MSEQLLAAKNAAMRRRVKISGVSGIMGIFFAPRRHFDSFKITWDPSTC